MHIKIHQKKD